MIRRFTLKKLNERAAKRPPGYVDRVLSLANVKDGMVTMSDEDWTELRKFYAPDEPDRTMRPPERIPDDYDPETSASSPKKRGCCDPPKP